MHCKLYAQRCPLRSLSTFAIATSAFTPARPFQESRTIPAEGVAITEFVQRASDDDEVEEEVVDDDRDVVVVNGNQDNDSLPQTATTAPLPYDTATAPTTAHPTAHPIAASTTTTTPTAHPTTNTTITTTPTTTTPTVPPTASAPLGEDPSQSGNRQGTTTGEPGLAWLVFFHI